MLWRADWTPSVPKPHSFFRSQAVPQVPFSPACDQSDNRFHIQPLSSERISFATGRMSWSAKRKPLSGHRDSYSRLTTQLLQSLRSATIRCYANCVSVFLSSCTSVHTQAHLPGSLSLLSEETYRWSGNVGALLLVTSVFDELMAQNLHLTFGLRSVSSAISRNFSFMTQLMD